MFRAVLYKPPHMYKPPHIAHHLSLARSLSLSLSLSFSREGGRTERDVPTNTRGNSVGLHARPRPRSARLGRTIAQGRDAVRGPPSFLLLYFPLLLHIIIASLRLTLDNIDSQVLRRCSVCRAQWH